CYDTHMERKNMVFEQEANSLFLYLNRQKNKSKSPESIFSGWIRESGVEPKAEHIPVLMRMIAMASDMSTDRQLLQSCAETL
ncbi:MAG: hypothetical protein LUE86_12920, partial [Clostridiales bacterium]|nr:hypothetical protein [Clostridiales bacterium]